MIPLLIPMKCGDESDNLCETWCTERDRNVCFQMDPELECSKSADHDNIICTGQFSIWFFFTLRLAETNCPFYLYRLSLFHRAVFLKLILKETSSEIETQIDSDPTWTDEESYLETESMFDIFSYWRRRKRCICDFKTECNTCPDFHKDSFRMSSQLETRFPLTATSCLHQFELYSKFVKIDQRKRIFVSFPSRIIWCRIWSCQHG